uniref:YspA cpYpsA-related SLOG domain-containing protein n=1 Tax=viral metagenome TaxID=1070528 RepID=A0A6M3LQJ5_9ZZZZ
MTIIVCGGRHFSNYSYLHGFLNCLNIIRPITRIRHGNASGADTYADEWARNLGIPREPCPAHWVRYGKAAGPIRNGDMLSMGDVDLVVAFPGGRGTADMVEQAKAAGVGVILA